MGRFRGFRGGSLIQLARKRIETQMAQPSARCEIRTLGEILIEDGSRMPSKFPMLARILIPEEVEIWDGIQTIRSCLVFYVWVRIHNPDYVLSFSTMGCITFGGSGLGVVVGFAL